MITPNYYISNKILYNIVNFELSLKDISSIPLPYKQKIDLNIQMRSENLFYISKIIGINTSLGECEKILLGKEVNIYNKSKIPLINYRNSLDYINQEAKNKFSVFGIGTLIHLNKILTNNWVESWNIGRLRNPQEEVNSVNEKWYTSIHNDSNMIGFTNEFSNILEWFNDKKLQVHPLIKISVIIFTLYKYFPFFTGNTITILCFTELLFYYFNMNGKGLVPISRSFYTFEGEYIDSLKACIESNDLTLWIERFTQGIYKDTLSISSQLIQYEEERIFQKKKQLLGLNSRQINLLNYLKKHTQITRKEYSDMHKISFMTSFRDLNELYKRKLIFQYGHGRATFYTLEKQIKNQEDIQSNEFQQFVPIGSINDDEFSTYGKI